VPPTLTSSFVVAPAQAGERLDRVLAAAFPGRSRSSLQTLVREGRVTIEGESARPSAAVHAGARIEVRFPEPPPAELVPEAIPLRVVHEDEDLLVIDKPAGMAVHPGAGNETGTLVHALLARGGALSEVGGPKRPGIVHRLDAGTSGLLVVARTTAAHHALAAQFRDRGVEKIYEAIVWGRPREASGTIEAAIGRDPVHRRKMSTRAPGGRAAVTHWRVLRSMPGFSHIALRIETGRTHQIRVHLQALGHPVVGDARYGGSGWRGVPDPIRRRALKGLGRPALHARRLSFVHPRTGERMTFESPLPPDLKELLELLGRER